MAGHVLELVLHLFIRNINLFGRSDLVDDQFRLHVFLGALFLPLPQRHPIQIHRPWINTLLRQRTHYSLEPHIFLMLHQ